MGENIYSWSTTASDNDDADASINFLEGQVPGSVNGSMRSVMASFAKYVADNNGTKTTAGSSGAYTLAVPAITYSALVNGLRLRVKANHTNGAACTFNLQVLGSRKIKKFAFNAEVELAAHDIIQDSHIDLEYDTSLDTGTGAWVLLNPASGGTLVGEIKDYAGSSLPAGYLFADGSSLSTTVFSALFAAFGYTYGGAGASFSLPDLRGLVSVGKDNMGGNTRGVITAAGSGLTGTTLGAALTSTQTITLITANLPSHTHTGNTSSDGAHTHPYSGNTQDESATHTHSGTTQDENATHTHSGTTQNDSPNHSHGINFTSGDDSPDHTHVGGGLFDAIGTQTFSISAGAGPAVVQTVNATGNENTGGRNGFHQHSIVGDTGGVSVNHQHGFTSGIESLVHQHGFTSGIESALHHHFFTGTTTDADAHSHGFTTAATGSGTAVVNVQPSIILNKIIKF